MEISINLTFSMKFHSTPYTLSPSKSPQFPSKNLKSNVKNPIVLLSPMQQMSSANKNVSFGNFEGKSEGNSRENLREKEEDPLPLINELKANLVLKDKEICRLKEIFRSKALEDSQKNEKLNSQLTLLAEKSDLMISERNGYETKIVALQNEIQNLELRLREMEKFEDQVESIDLITSSLEGRLKCSLQENETLMNKLGS